MKTSFTVQFDDGTYEILSVRDIDGSLYLIHHQDDALLQEPAPSNHLSEGPVTHLDANSDFWHVRTSDKSASLSSQNSTHYFMPMGADFCAPLLAKSFQTFSNRYKYEAQSGRRTINVASMREDDLACLMTVVVIASEAAVIPQIGRLTLTVAEFPHWKLAIYAGYFNFPAGAATGALVRESSQRHLAIAAIDGKHVDPQRASLSNTNFTRQISNLAKQCLQATAEQVAQSVPRQFQAMVRKVPVSYFASPESLAAARRAGRI